MERCTNNLQAFLLMFLMSIHVSDVLWMFLVSIWCLFLCSRLFLLVILGLKIVWKMCQGLKKMTTDTVGLRLLMMANVHSWAKKMRHWGVWLLSDVQMFCNCIDVKQQWYKMICKPISYWSYIVYFIMCWKFHGYAPNFNWFIILKDWTWKYKDSCLPHCFWPEVYITVR